jgi:hypothetical protein
MQDTNNLFAFTPILLYFVTLETTYPEVLTGALLFKCRTFLRKQPSAFKLSQSDEFVTTLKMLPRKVQVEIRPSFFFLFLCRRQLQQQHVAKTPFGLRWHSRVRFPAAAESYFYLRWCCLYPCHYSVSTSPWNILCQTIYSFVNITNLFQLRVPGTKFTGSLYQQIFTMEHHNVVLHLGIYIPETQAPIPFEVLVYIFASLSRIAHCKCWSSSGLATGPKYSSKRLVDI